MRQELAEYLGQRVFCRGRVRDTGDDRNAICFESLTVDPGISEPLLHFEHIWLRRGVDTAMLKRMAPGEWFSFTAKVWRYQRQRDGEWTGEVDFGLAYPEDVHRSYN